ncbi:putative ATPase [Roseibium album]|nr:putative ATPase [Roseibium album]
MKLPTSSYFQLYAARSKVIALLLMILSLLCSSFQRYAYRLFVWIFLCVGSVFNTAWAADTVFQQHLIWGNVRDFYVYYNKDLLSCVLEKYYSENDRLLLGYSYDLNLYLFGFNSSATESFSEDVEYEVTISFDNGETISGSMSGMVSYGRMYLFGTFSDHQNLRRNIADRSTMTLLHDGQQLASFSLSGTKSALEFADDCLNNQLVKLVEEKWQTATEHLRAGRFHEAAPIYEQLQNFMAANSNVSRLSYARLLADRAEVLSAVQRHEEAETLLLEAVSLLEATDDERKLGYLSGVLNTLASQLSSRGEFEQATEFANRALAVARQRFDGNRETLAITLDTLGRLHHDQHQYEKAERYYREALETAEELYGSTSRRIVAPMLGLAAITSNTNQMDISDRLYGRAISILGEHLDKDHPYIASALTSYGKLLVRMGKNEEALQVYQRSLEIQKASLGLDHPSTASTLKELAVSYFSRKDYGQALAFARQAKAAPNRDVYLASGYFMNRENLEQFLEESFEVFQRSTSSSAALALRNLDARIAAGSDAMAKLVRKKQDNERELSQMQSKLLDVLSKDPAKRFASDETAIRSKLSGARDTLGEVNALLDSAYPDYAELKKPTPLTIREVQSHLDPDEAMIVVDSGGVGEYVWVVTDTDARWQMMAGGKDTEELVAEIRSHLNIQNRNRTPLTPPVPYELYRKLFWDEALEGLFREKKHLLFVLNGPISSLPPSVLVSDPLFKEGWPIFWLGLTHSITVLPSVSSLKILRDGNRTTPNTRKIKGFGDPQFGTQNAKPGEKRTQAYTAYYRNSSVNLEAMRIGLPPLPGTRTELQSVFRNLEAPESDLLLGASATEAAVKTADLTPYEIIYFATHGLVSGEVKYLAEEIAEPALAFSIPLEATETDDGLLTASEIAQLKLNANWVVLSACNTAAAERTGADALSGLASAFLYAGSRSLLVSHWVIDDAATSHLMSQTFAFAANQPNGRAADALKHAIETMFSDADHPEWSDPVYWAPFILVGEPLVQ